MLRGAAAPPQRPKGAIPEVDLHDSCPDIDDELHGNGQDMDIEELKPVSIQEQTLDEKKTQNETDLILMNWLYTALDIGRTANSIEIVKLFSQKLLKDPCVLQLLVNNVPNIEANGEEAKKFVFKGGAEVRAASPLQELPEQLRLLVDNSKACVEEAKSVLAKCIPQVTPPSPLQALQKSTVKALEELMQKDWTKEMGSMQNIVEERCNKLLEEMRSLPGFDGRSTDERDGLAEQGEGNRDTENYLNPDVMEQAKIIRQHLGMLIIDVEDLSRLPENAAHKVDLITLATELRSFVEGITRLHKNLCSPPEIEAVHPANQQPDPPADDLDPLHQDRDPPMDDVDVGDDVDANDQNQPMAHKPSTMLFQVQPIED